MHASEEVWQQFDVFDFVVVMCDTCVMDVWQIVRACPSMLNEVKMRGLGVALAAVKRSENAADERDEVRQTGLNTCYERGIKVRT